ncbi:MAG: GTP-binding protein, partial [Candidatus Parvarchaeota archaeon]|nr:GTP-binding protein [Candidatus Parvarchaeota archaeon]
MNSIVVGVIGPYKSGKTSLVNRLQQRKGVEEDVAFYFFKYSGKNVTLIDTPGDTDAPSTVASVISISDACVLCISPETKINFQVGEQIILMDNLGVTRGLICITKSDLSTPEEIEQLKENIRETISNTSLKDMEIMDVNINDDQKIANVRAKIAEIPYDSTKPKKSLKLAVDHAFESKGMSIAVGTMISGKISVHSEG